MSKSNVFQIIKDDKTRIAVSEYIALGELDRTAVKTKEDREAWEELWHEFLNSKMWILAIVFIQKHGI